MCTETTYTLRCQHVLTQTSYCHDAPKSKSSKSSSSSSSRKHHRKTCKKLTRASVPYPPPGQEVRCPLPACPFELRGGYWNCCWCGKGWNDTGRCRCVMVGDRQELYRCEHICCDTCEASQEYA